jgi:AraC family transcriptional regulator of adaptative response/methylated-DNA-[protein]-cysteine methyltransferase
VADYSTYYNTIESAIDFISKQHSHQPSLEEIAAHVHLSPFHFQRLFTEWSGISPKKFLQFISVSHAKQLLHQNPQRTLFETTDALGLSSTSRLHDLFITIEGMTPAEYKNGGKNLEIGYSFNPTPFGELIIATTQRGICNMTFNTNRIESLEKLQLQFPNATIIEDQSAFATEALKLFQMDWNELAPIKLHLKGTNFQLKVWECLLKIPLGNLTTYGIIASKIGSPKASRAVGTAIGNNPIAFLIPCHRVIQSSGQIGGYMWGPSRKKAIIGWESARLFTEE